MALATGEPGMERARHGRKAAVAHGSKSDEHRRTHLTGLRVTAFFSQRYSKSDDSADRRCRTLLPSSLGMRISKSYYFLGDILG